MPTPPTPRPPRLSTSAAVLSGLLLALPLVALAIVPVYSRTTPQLWGFPFFYWYQLAWVFLAAGCTALAYVIVVRGRRNK